jgi:long-subunit fatty acid transport protein
MKKLALVVTLVLAAGSAFATAFLVGQSTSGQLRYCKYSNGAVMTVDVADLCPLQIN